MQWNLRAPALYGMLIVYLIAKRCLGVAYPALILPFFAVREMRNEDHEAPCIHQPMSEVHSE